MDDIWKTILQATSNRLLQLTASAKQMNETTGRESQQDAILNAEIVASKLESVLLKVANDLNNYFKFVNTPSADEVSVLSTNQLEAEEVLSELKVKIKHAKDVTTTTKYVTGKLPVLGLPIFNGDILNWHSFWDQFRSQIDQRDLSDVDKFLYLCAALKGEAKSLVEGLQATNESYGIAITTLKERYGRAGYIKDAHYTALNKVIPANETIADCRRTFNEIERHLRVLQALGEDASHSFFRTLIFEKFPENIVYELKRVIKDDSINEIRAQLAKLITDKEDVCKTRPNSINKEECTTGTLQVVDGNYKKGRVRPHNIFNERHEFKKTHPQKRPFTEIKPNQQYKKKPRTECCFCKTQTHYSDKCRKYSTLKDRKDKLVNQCYLCLREGHMVKDCRMSFKCCYCKGKHNRALCPKELKSAAGPVGVSGESTQLNLENVKTNTTSLLCSMSCLQTATASARNKAGHDTPQSCRILLDCGSQRSYITTKLAQSINLLEENQDLLMVYTFGSDKPKEILSAASEIVVETKRGLQKRMRVNVVPHITNTIPIVNFPDKISVDIIADDGSLGEGIDLLIGNDYYFSFIRENHRQIGQDLHLIDTDFGWMLSGSTDSNIYDNTLSVITYCQCHGPSCPYFTEPDLPLRNVDMKFLWALESIGITDSPKTTREEEAVKSFNDTVKYEEGRYTVKWPWIEYPPDIPTNYSLAYGRLKSLLKRSDTATLKEFDQILSEQLNANIIEVIEPKTIPIYQVDPPIHYLPNHMVKQEGKRGRIVYDASAKVKDHKSLNECMYRGPSMLEDLTALLLKFRCREIGITADIEKAFLQVGLQDDDKDVTRFLWVKDLSKEPTEDNLLHYRFCRMAFGIISSPFLLTATIRHHLSQRNETLLKNIADRCYVDNLVTCAEDYKTATTLYKETRSVFKELGMNIREWMSNDKTFMETIPEPLRAPQKDRIKVLGLMWNVEKDSLELKLNEKTSEVNVQENKLTKRDVLRTLARVYDPCGFASPLILPAKIFFQQLCGLKIKWDMTLSTELIHKWLSIVNILKLTKEIEIPRYVGNVLQKGNVKYELHTFTDASMKAYAAVTYVCIVGEKEIKTGFLMSKARITPLEDQQSLKIPRLELLAYLIGSRLMKYVKANLDLPIEKQYLWTDSLIVLSWIKSNKLLAPFITRRVNEIKQNKDFEFRYVSTKENPADLATRPELWEIKKELWFSGPEFLFKEPIHWPSSTKSEERHAFLVAGEGLDISDDPDISKEVCEKDVPDIFDDPGISMEVCDDVPDIHLGIELECHPTNEQEFANQEVTDINVDKIRLTEIINLQKEHFPEEVTGKETHLTRNLGLYLDVDGLLRSRGRLSNTRWSYDMKHPILLPPKSNFTDKVIRDTHEENYHVGVPHTLNIIREKYWIPQGRTQVQRVLKTCNQCIKQGGGPYRLPPTSALPAERVNYSEPYTYTGLDYFGPVMVATKLGNEKRWVCLYTCLAVRAVHMEIVNDLTAEEFLLAFRRFTASRGKPKMVLSDNASQFKLTSELLTSAYCEQNSIMWKFIPQLAPWHGGVYERLVALAKHCMKRTLEKHLLNDNQLLTVIKEIERVINTRPLTYVGADLDRVLRPVDFLSLGNCLVPEPTETDIMGKSTTTKVDLVASWKRGTMILGEFKDMFIRQYLPSLREKHRYFIKQPRTTSDKSPQAGDIVQIFDDSKKRIIWKVGKITTLIKSRDGHCRVAKVKVGNVELTRSIGHLYPLETECSKEASGPETPVVEQMELTLPPDPNIELDKMLKERPELENFQPQKQDMMEVINEVHSSEEAEEVQGADLPSKQPEVTDIPQEESFQSELDNTPQESEHSDLPANMRPERIAAQRAREKIAEWTRHLVALL